MLDEGFLNRVRDLFLIELNQTLPSPQAVAAQMADGGESEFQDLSRRFHGLAGASGLAHFHALSGLFHSLEELFAQMGQGDKGQGARDQLRGGLYQNVYDLVHELAATGSRPTQSQHHVLRDLDTLLGLKPEAASHQEEEKAQATKVLVVDDDRVSLYVIEEVLRSAGYEVQSTLDCDQAPRMAKDFNPDLLILDVVLGERSGFDLARQFRADAASQLTPIILVSVKADVGTKIEGFQSGATDYLAKPFAPAELLARVSAILERTRMFKDLALRDGLTGAFNHRYLQERLDEELHRHKRTKKPFAIAMLDIDHFKSVNDGHGHQVGDQVLVQFTASLKTQLRDMDVVARYGGEEFVIIMLEAGAEDCAFALDRVRETVSDSELVPGLKISFSGGMAMVPRDGLHKKDLLHLADQRLYQAKNGGRNRLVTGLEASR